MIARLLYTVALAVAASLLWTSALSVMGILGTPDGYVMAIAGSALLGWLVSVINGFGW